MSQRFQNHISVKVATKMPVSTTVRSDGVRFSQVGGIRTVNSR